MPSSITQFATPYTVVNKVKADLGIYVQDRWTIHRLAVNGGLRFDYFNGYVPAEHVPATPSGWIPERNFDVVHNVPNWFDVNPRVGASYDLFGTGAPREGVGRALRRPDERNVAAATNPIVTSVNTVRARGPTSIRISSRIAIWELQRKS